MKKEATAVTGLAPAAPWTTLSAAERAPDRPAAPTLHHANRHNWASACQYSTTYNNSGVTAGGFGDGRRLTWLAPPGMADVSRTRPYDRDPFAVRYTPRTGRNVRKTPVNIAGNAGDMGR
jgi:hypothetical protein